MASFDSNSSKDGISNALTDSGTYRLDSEGQLTVVIEGGRDKNEGIASNGSGVILLASLDDQNEQVITVGVVSGVSTHTNADLVGKYNAVFFSRSGSGTFGAIGTMTFDGAGAFELYQQFSQSWGVGTGTHTGSGTYAINSDDTLVISGTGREGAISANGKTFVLAMISDVSEQSIAIGVKAGNDGYTNASLKGIYRGANMLVNTGGRYSSLIKINFDGERNWVAEERYNSSASGANQSQTMNGTYSVNSDGSFTINSQGETTRGALSEDGRAFVFARVETTLVQDIGFAVKDKAQ